MITSLTESQATELISAEGYANTAYALAMAVLVDVGAFPPEGVYFELSDGTYILMFQKADSSIVYAHTDYAPPPSNFNALTYVLGEFGKAVKKNTGEILDTGTDWLTLAAVAFGAYLILR